MYDDCSFCGGRVQERLIPKVCWWGEQIVAIVDDVPTGVCDQCGERYYKAQVLKEIEELLAQRDTRKTVCVPLAQYTPA